MEKVASCLLKVIVYDDFRRIFDNLRPLSTAFIAYIIFSTAFLKFSTSFPECFNYDLELFLEALDSLLVFFSIFSTELIMVPSGRD